MILIFVVLDTLEKKKKIINNHIKIKYYIEYNISYMTENLKNEIEKMDKNHHIEILKIIIKNPASKINENKSGVYINLSFLSDETIEEINKYVNHVKYQEELLNPFENEKESLKNTFYSTEEVAPMLFENTQSKEVPIEYITKPNKDNNVSIFSY